MATERDQADVVRVVINNRSVYEYLKDFLNDLKLQVSHTNIGITRDN